MIRRVAPAAAVPVAAALATGCFSVPPYEPETRVSYAQDGTGATVTGTGTGFTLHFASGDHFHFPDRLTIDGTDVLGHAPAPACDVENDAGLKLSPTPRISAGSEAPRVTNRLDAVLRGPAVVQMKLTWASQFACSLAHAPGGTSTFTVFPDGRIVRHDTLEDPVPGALAASDCACPSAFIQDGFTVSSYWTLAPAAFKSLYVPGDSADPKDAATLEGQNFPNFGLGCLDGGTYQVAASWRDAESSQITGTGGLIVLGRELTFRASRIDDLLPWSTSSALVIGRPDQLSPCETALARAREFIIDPTAATPPALAINGTAALPSDRDGIYGGDSGTGSPGLLLRTSRATLTGVVNGSFAVWLRFPSSVGALRARLAGATGAWYVPQQVDDRTWIVWFQTPLGTGQTIVIEPR